MEYVTFKKAVPVWEKGKEKEKNYNLIFKETVKKGSFKIRITGSSVYSLFVNRSRPHGTRILQGRRAPPKSPSRRKHN